MARLSMPVYFFLDDPAMLNTAWIDRPVDTRAALPLPRPFRAAWNCSHAHATCDR
jgi:hypothetical protein